MTKWSLVILFQQLHRLPQVICPEVGVDLGGGDACMTEKLANVIDRNSFLDETRCEGVAEGVEVEGLVDI